MTMHRPSPSVRRRRESGGATTELVLVTPLLIVLLLFVVFAGRMATSRGRVIDAAGAAARAASIERSPDAARQAAEDIVDARLADKNVSCSSLRVDTDTTRFEPGGEVSVTVRCTIELDDLTLLAVPGDRVFESTAVEVIDFYRGID